MSYERNLGEIGFSNEVDGLICCKRKYGVHCKGYLRKTWDFRHFFPTVDALPKSSTRRIV